MSTALGKTCTACGIERKKRGVKYHPETFMPYCENPWICNDEHPNSTKNLLARGEELKLLELEEAQEGLHNWIYTNHPDKDKADRIRRMVTHPTTVRLGSPEDAKFLLHLEEELGFASVSDAIRYCVRTMREQHWTYNHEVGEIKETKRMEEELLETAQQMTEELKKPAQEERKATKFDPNEDLGTF